MIRCLFPTLVLAFAEIAICLGKKTTATPKDCDNKLDAEIDTVLAMVKCGKNPFPDFIPQRCRIFQKDNARRPTSEIKVTLDAGEKKMFKGTRCEYRNAAAGALSIFEGSGSSSTATAEFLFSICKGRTEAGWIDKSGYGIYCDKSPYPPVIPVSCDFGGKTGVIPAGRKGGVGNEKMGECYYNYKDASITPNWRKLGDVTTSQSSITERVLSDTPLHI